MTLNLYDILQEVINESVSPGDVSDAITNRYRVVINYSDEENHAPQWRVIEPYVLGRSKGGNDVFRAFQYDGDSWRSKTLGGEHKIPQWRLFRLDRVKTWKPTKQHFNGPPEEHLPNAFAYNENGDGSMSEIYTQVHFDYDDKYNNPYIKGSDLYKLRKNIDNKRSSTPINMSDIKTELPGPVTNNTAQSEYDMDMIKRNLAYTEKEKARRGFSLSNKNTTPTGPILPPVDTHETDNGNQTQNVSGPITPSHTVSDYDMDMIKRNLAYTEKEKARRGFSLKNKKR